MNKNICLIAAFILSITAVIYAVCERISKDDEQIYISNSYFLKSFTKSNNKNQESIEVINLNTIIFESEHNYTNDDLILLAKLINAEASDMCTDEHKMWTGSVALNRIKDSRFPDNLYDVIYQTKPVKQYSSAWNGAIKKTPSKRSLDCAKRLLEGEKVCNENIIWQSEIPQGTTIKTFKTKISTTYFGY